MESMLRGREDVPTDLPSTRASCLLRTLSCHASTLRQVFHEPSPGSTGLGSLLAPNVGNALRAKKDDASAKCCEVRKSSWPKGKTSARPPFRKPLKGESRKGENERKTAKTDENKQNQAKKCGKRSGYYFLLLCLAVPQWSNSGGHLGFL